MERVRVVEEVVKVADNFIVLFDASGSMQDQYKFAGQKKIDLAKQIYEARTSKLPDLDWNAGLYLYTPWKSFYDMQPFNKEAYADALDQLAAYKPSIMFRNQPTPLGDAIKNLDPILAKLSGKTVVFIFSDGQFSLSQPKIWPVPAARELASPMMKSLPNLRPSTRGFPSSRNPMRRCIIRSCIFQGPKCLSPEKPLNHQFPLAPI